MRPEFVTLRNHPDVSVLIIGGGINGIGLFDELALQGIDVLLVEKSDFCAGTSAAMTRVIHGGLRYLENAEFRLVRESLRERNRLLRNAPHYVKPLPTTIPIFSWTSGIVSGIRNLLELARQAGQSRRDPDQGRIDAVRLSRRPQVSAAATPVPLQASGPRDFGPL